MHNKWVTLNLRSIYLSLACLVIATFPSCKVDGEEELIIHANGKTEIKVNYLLPRVGLSLSDGQKVLNYLKEIDRRQETISLTSSSCQKAANQTVRLQAHLICDTAIGLENIIPQELELLKKTDLLDDRLKAKVAIVIGEIQLDPSSTHVDYRRSIALQKLIKDELGKLGRLGRIGGASSQRLLGDSSFRYSLTTHQPCSGHNAHIVSNNGRTLTWKMLLREHVDSPFVMQAQLPIPWKAVLGIIPWWGWVAALLALIIGLALLWKFSRWLTTSIFGSKP